MKKPQYSLEIRSKTGYGREIYKFSSADGVSPKDGFRDEELALADHMEPSEDDKMLITQSGYGFLGAVFGDMTPEAETVLADTSSRAHQLSKMNMKENDITSTSCEKLGFYTEIERSFDNIIYAPQNYQPVDLVKNRIENLIHLLNYDGSLYIAGRKKTGFKRYRKHLEEMKGDMKKIAQEGAVKIYMFKKNGQITVEKTEIEKEHLVEIDGENLEFMSCEGLFSAGKLDSGTELLLKNTDISDDRKVLDLACGYGTVAAYTASKADIDLYLSDDNGLACHYAEQNLENNGIKEYELRHSDCLEGFKHESFDLILSNPPTHQGKGVTDEMFSSAHGSLNRGGSLVIVYNSNMRFEDSLKELFSSTEVLEEQDGFKVLRADK